MRGLAMAERLQREAIGKYIPKPSSSEYQLVGVHVANGSYEDGRSLFGSQRCARAF